MNIIWAPFRAATATVVLLIAGGVAQAETLTFQTLNDSGDTAFNQLLGINNAGTIAGYFGDGSSGQPNKGYTLVPSSGLPLDPIRKAVLG